MDASHEGEAARRRLASLSVYAVELSPTTSWVATARAPNEEIKCCLIAEPA